MKTPKATEPAKAATTEPPKNNVQRLRPLVPENETKRARFERLARRRMTRVLKGFKLLGNLGNRGEYEFSDRDVAKMTDALREALGDFESRMRRRDGEFEFTFD